MVMVCICDILINDIYSVAGVTQRTTTGKIVRSLENISYNFQTDGRQHTYPYAIKNQRKARKKRLVEQFLESKLNIKWRRL